MEFFFIFIVFFKYHILFIYTITETTRRLIMVKCSMLHDQEASNIGITQNNLSESLTLYLQNGCIKDLFLYHHNKIVIRRELVSSQHLDY